MNPSSHCSTSFFEEEFKFQYVRGDIHIHIATQNLIWHFCQSGTLCGNVNMEVFPNIWNKNAFGTTTLYALVVLSSFKDESCKIGYVPQLNSNWRVYDTAIFPMILSRS